jgi:microsomal dipeptidase-like Zn-dependent dipeptidase
MDLSGFKAIFDSMTPEERKAKIDALTEINKLKQLCYGKGYIEIGSDFKSIKILQNNKEVKRLQEFFEKAGIRGVEWKVED